MCHVVRKARVASTKNATLHAKADYMGSMTKPDGIGHVHNVDRFADVLLWVAVRRKFKIRLAASH